MWGFWLSLSLWTCLLLDEVVIYMGLLHVFYFWWVACTWAVVVTIFLQLWGFYCLLQYWCFSSCSICTHLIIIFNFCPVFDFDLTSFINPLIVLMFAPLIGLWNPVPLNVFTQILHLAALISVIPFVVIFWVLLLYKEF